MGYWWKELLFHQICWWDRSSSVNFCLHKWWIGLMTLDMDVWEIRIKFLDVQIFLCMIWDGFTVDYLNMCECLYQNVSSASSYVLYLHSENNTTFWKFIHISALVIFLCSLLILINVPYIFYLCGYYSPTKISDWLIMSSSTW
jgi:hypothetical protein